MRLASALFACLAVGQALSIRAEVNRHLADTGPLRIRDQFLLGMGFLGFDPGRWQVDVIATVTTRLPSPGPSSRPWRLETGASP